MKVKRIAGGYYEIIYHGYYFSLEQCVSGLWRLYITNQCFDPLNRLVLSRTKKGALDILDDYNIETIERITNSRFAKQMEV